MLMRMRREKVKEEASSVKASDPLLYLIGNHINNNIIIL